MTVCISFQSFFYKPVFFPWDFIAGKFAMLFKGKHGLYVKAYKIIKIIMCCISLPSPDAESEVGNAEA